MVAAPLAFLAAGLVSYAVVEALTRAFYAMHDTRTPVIAGVVIIALNIVLWRRPARPALRLPGPGLGLEPQHHDRGGRFCTVVLHRRLGGVAPGFGSWLLRVASSRLAADGRCRRSGAAARRGHPPGRRSAIATGARFLLAACLSRLVYLAAPGSLTYPGAVRDVRNSPGACHRQSSRLALSEVRLRDSRILPTIIHLIAAVGYTPDWLIERADETDA